MVHQKLGFKIITFLFLKFRIVYLPLKFWRQIKRKDLLKKTSHAENCCITMASHGLYSLVYQPTRITEETSSCIDQIPFRRSLKVRIDDTSWLINSDITDHDDSCEPPTSSCH